MSNARNLANLLGTKTKVKDVDVDGTELVLDADGDTSITADTDDQIDIKIAGADDFRFTANTFTALSGSTIAAQALTATTIGATGVVTANAGVVVDNITIDGTEIDLSSGDLTIDVAGNITLDADGTVIALADGGTEFAQLFKPSGGGFSIYTPVSDADFKVVGNDGGSTVTALTLDMSDAGAATLNNGLTLSDGDLTVASGHGINFAATSDASGMTSELLDDYEEGTWTPSIVGSSSESGQSYSTQDGFYVKIGRMVHAKFRVVLSAEGTFNGTYLLITGLPYTAASSPQATHLNNCYFVNIGVNVYSVGLQLSENDNKMYLWAVKDANTSRAYLANTDLTSTTELGASIVYQTA